MSDILPEPHLLDLTAAIVAACLEKNPVPADALPALIQKVYQALTSLAGGSAKALPVGPAAKSQLAAHVKRSIFPDYLICLEDGRKMQTLKRHLTTYNLTPDQYRARWHLPASYPMTAPSYSQKRSEIAKQLGLGRRRQVAADPSVPVVTQLRARRAKGSRG